MGDKLRKTKRLWEIWLTLILFIIFGIAQINMVSATTWNSTFSNGLVSYWGFDEGTGTLLTDLKNGQNGIIVNSPSWVSGKSGTALYFNGINQYVNISNSEYFNNTQVTINAWVKMNKTETPNYPTIIDKDDGTERAWALGIDNPSYAGKWSARVLDGGLGRHAEGGNNTISNYNGAWQMITMTVGSDLILYQNGTNVGSAGTGHSLPNVTANILIGAYDATGTRMYLNGSIDEIAIWNRELSASEIKSLWDSGAGIFFAGGSVALNSPDNNYLSIPKNINFNCSATGSALLNLTLNIDGVNEYTISNTTASQTNLSIYYGKTYTSYTNHSWNCRFATFSLPSGLSSPSRAFNITNLITNSQTYNSATYETANENFIINISYSSEFTLSYGTLNYKGTNYAGTISNYGNNAIISRSVEVPSGIGNNSFYWTIALVNSTGSISYYNSSINNQSVIGLSLYPCTISSGLTLNFTTYDNANFLPLNSSFEATFSYFGVGGSGTNSINTTYQYLLENKSNFMFCLNSSGQNVSLNAFVNYYATGYTPRSYIISQGIIGNFTQNIPLYLGTTTSTDIVTITITDQNYNPLPGAIVNIQQWIVGTNTYPTIGMFTTSSDGTGIMNLVLYDIWYRASITYQGKLVKVTDVQKLSGTTWNIIVSLSVNNPYDLFGSISHGLTFNNSTNITTFTWSDSSGYTQQGCLIVNKLNSYGTTEVYNSCIVSVSGTINYQIVGDGDYEVNGIVYLTPAYNISQLVDTLSLRLGKPALASVVSNFGKVLSFVFIGTSAMIGIAAASPIYGIILLMASVFFSFKLGWINMTWAIFEGIVILGLVILFRLSRRNG